VSVLLFYQQPEFPPLWLGIACLCLPALLIWALYLAQTSFKLKAVFQARVFAVLNVTLGVIIGISWVFWQTFFMPEVPERVLNQPVFITGKIIELPNQELTKGRAKIQYRIKVDSIAFSSASQATTYEDVSYAYNLTRPFN